MPDFHTLLLVVGLLGQLSACAKSLLLNKKCFVINFSTPYEISFFFFFFKRNFIFFICIKNKLPLRYYITNVTFCISRQILLLTIKARHFANLHFGSRFFERLIFSDTFYKILIVPVKKMWITTIFEELKCIAVELKEKIKIILKTNYIFMCFKLFDTIKSFQKNK